MLFNYQKTYDFRSRLQFIDIFVVWAGSEAQFKCFLDYCNKYASTSIYASNIPFKTSLPAKSVTFVNICINHTISIHIIPSINHTLQR